MFLQLLDKGKFVMSDNNKNAAISFLELASSGRVMDAYSKFIGNGFRHHNPFFEGSAEALHAAMKENAIQNPRKAIDVKRVIAEGEFVVVHFLVKHKPDELGAAVMQIFRFENGRIVELWDLGQPIPEKSPNQYGMF
jgi:predicted SnoaL-like aldol condensation-catalyzing enzyme